MILLVFLEICKKLNIASSEEVLQDISYFNNQLKEYLNELETLDVEKWQVEMGKVNSITSQLSLQHEEKDLQELLIKEIEMCCGKVPWAEYENFDDFMSDPDSVLRLE